MAIYQNVLLNGILQFMPSGNRERETDRQRELQTDRDRDEIIQLCKKKRKKSCIAQQEEKRKLSFKRKSLMERIEEI